MELLPLSFPLLRQEDAFPFFRSRGTSPKTPPFPSGGTHLLRHNQRGISSHLLLLHFFRHVPWVIESPVWSPDALSLVTRMAAGIIAIAPHSTMVLTTRASLWMKACVTPSATSARPHQMPDISPRSPIPTDFPCLSRPFHPPLLPLTLTLTLTLPLPPSEWEQFPRMHHQLLIIIEPKHHQPLPPSNRSRVPQSVPTLPPLARSSAMSNSTPSPMCPMTGMLPLKAQLPLHPFPSSPSREGFLCRDPSLAPCKKVFSPGTNTYNIEVSCLDLLNAVSCQNAALCQVPLKGASCLALWREATCLVLSRIQSLQIRPISPLPLRVHTTFGE